MATLVRGIIPAEEFALHDTLERLPEVEIECERIVQGRENVILPLLWVRNADRQEFESALEEDPTVDDVNCLSEFDDEALYRMKWVDRVRLLPNFITNGEATILDAYGRNDRWHVRVLYPGREHFSRSHQFATEHGLTFDIGSIRELEGEPAGRFGLTDGQYRALVLAFDRGYYEVPKRANLEDVARELDISHRSPSERLRRGTGALIEDTLIIGAMADEANPTRRCRARPPHRPPSTLVDRDPYTAFVVEPVHAV
jgi:predicted DNA binding protein